MKIRSKGIARCMMVACCSISFPVMAQYTGGDGDGFAVASSGSEISLPIELVSFRAGMTGSMVRLDWVSASEVNNDHYTVEKSDDGKHWTFVSQVQGAGNSSTEQYYAAYDHNPYNGVSYYRLRQTDYDGTSEDLKTVAVGSESMEDQQAFLFANPITNRLEVQMTGTTGDMQISIYNTSGMLVMTYPPGAGSSLDITALSNGLYFVRAQYADGAGEVFMGKFIKAYR